MEKMFPLGNDAALRGDKGLMIPSVAQLERGRMRQVDSLRAVAALLVVWTHTRDTFASASSHNPSWLDFLRWFPEWANLGRAGVSLFFIISGFVIFGTLSGRGKGTGRRFLIRRFLRLYPVFWLSLLTAVIAFGGIFPSWDMLKVAAANATMFTSLFGKPWILGLYWTLEVELVFYLLCYTLYATRILEKFWVVLSLSLFFSVLFFALENISASQGDLISLLTDQWLKMPRHLSTMFWGAALRWLYDHYQSPVGSVSARNETWGFGLTTVLLLSTPTIGFIQWWLTSSGAQPPSSIAYPLAMIFALLWICLWRPAPRWLVWIGIVSYSLYLFHPLLSRPLIESLGTTQPLWLIFLEVLVSNIALSSLIYLSVERPCIQWSHRLTRGK